MHLFYIPEIHGNFVGLNEAESKHCVKVLRLAEGDEVQMVDGKGGFYNAVISKADIKKTILKITARQIGFEKRDYYLHIGIAPTKNIGRFEWFLEKATEIGIDEITPLVSAHSERKTVKAERLKKILISAMKQSVKAFLPKLNEITLYARFIELPFEGSKFIAHCHSTEEAPLKGLVEKKKKVIILIGPEGDFSEKEIQDAQQHGFTGVSLGNSRLRTETAGVVACHTVSLINQ